MHILYLILLVKLQCLLFLSWSSRVGILSLQWRGRHTMEPSAESKADHNTRSELGINAQTHISRSAHAVTFFPFSYLITFVERKSLYVHTLGHTHTSNRLSNFCTRTHTHMPLFIKAVISNLKQLLLLTDVQVAVSLSRSLRERCKLIQTMCVRRQNLFFDRATKAAAGTAFQFHAWPSVNSKLIVDETMIS